MGVTKEERILHKQLQAIAKDGARLNFFSENGQGIAWRLIMATGMKMTPSKTMASILLGGFPQLKEADANGNITSVGRLEKIYHAVEVKKFSSALPLDAIDYKSLSQVGNIMEVEEGLVSAYNESVLHSLSALINGLTTGEFVETRADGSINVISTLLTHGGEKPAQASRTTGHWVKDGVNIAPNTGTTEFSADGVLEALSLIRRQKTIYDTTIPFNVAGIIVDRSKYDEAVEVVSNRQFGTDLQNRIYLSNLPVGYVDMENPKDWIIITDKANLGQVFFPGYLFPNLRLVPDNRTENVEFIADWYMNNYCASPTGFYLNKFSS